MPRYFFNFRGSEDDEPDKVGLELADAEQARHEAIAGARSIINERLQFGEARGQETIDVMDERGGVLFTVEFSDIAKGRFDGK